MQNKTLNDEKHDILNTMSWDFKEFMVIAKSLVYLGDCIRYGADTYKNIKSQNKQTTNKRGE